MTRIAGELLDIKVILVLVEGMPTNDKCMWNADRLSSRPIGDTSILLNTAYLGENGNLLSGSVMPVLNARNTPRWTENDQTCHDKKWKGKGKTGKNDGDVDRCVHHLGAVPYSIWFKIKVGTNMPNTIECVCFVVYDSYTPLIHSCQLTTKSYPKQFRTRLLLCGQCLCPNLYGSVCNWDKFKNLTINIVWLIQKSKEDYGFQEWHRDFKYKITATIVVNVGAVTKNKSQVYYFHFWWKNTLCLKFWHIVALWHLETEKETTLELRLVNLRVVVQFAFKLGYLLW